MLNVLGFVPLSVLYLVQWRLAHSQSGTCESSGLCRKTGGSCEGDSIKSCFHGYGGTFLKYVTYDDEGAGEEVRTYCRVDRCTGPDTPSNIFLKNVTLSYASINPRYFKLTVSWSITESSGSRGGYELRLINILGRISLCYCVEDSNQTTVTLHNLKYKDLDKYKRVDVLSYPHPQIDENEIKRSELLNQNIRGCADIEHNGTLCGIQPYPKPENLSVESSWCGNDTKTLNITWDPPNVSPDVPLPDIYHVELNSEPHNYIYRQYFSVQNARQVVLVNVSATQKYKVYVDPYLMCSGLGNASAATLGCGAYAEQIEDRVGYCDPSTPELITTSHRSEGTTEEQFNVTRHMNLVPVLTSVIITLNIVLVIAVSLVSLLCIKLNKRLQSESHSCNLPTMMVDRVYTVFVFYLPSVSQTHKIYIQKYVIGNLQKYFKVVTPDDISRGNISVWLEDAVNSADSVLLVGNKELCFEWGKRRLPILNSLELIISAAASQNTIAKFGFISIEERTTDVLIPENSYLKLMPVFFMGKKMCEVEKVYRFVTRSRGIELAQASHHDDVKV